MDQSKCPLCYSEDCNISVTESGYYMIECPNCNINVNINRYFLDCCNSLPIYHKALNLIYEHTLRTPFKDGNRRWYFYYEETERECNNDAKINIFTFMKDYPQGFIDMLNRVLLNLSCKYPMFGEQFWITTENFRLFYPATGTGEDAYGVLQMLEQMGYVNKDESGTLSSISAEGWKKIEILRKKAKEVKQGFVAMRFGKATIQIREGFRQAITDAGYTMRAIDEKEHNNQIVPEIFYEIERSKFVVVDVTYPNYGAYYEAGYAYGLGKEVIVCCSKEAFENKDGTFERPHFDISQKSMVIWDDIEDLKVRLTRRIQATVK